MVLKLALNIVTLQLQSQAREPMPIQITRRVVDVAEMKRDKKKELKSIILHFLLDSVSPFYCILSSFIYYNLFNIISFFFCINVCLNI